MKRWLLSIVVVISFFSSGNCQSWLWAKGASGTGFATISADSFGHIYATGAFRSPIMTFGSSTVINNASDSTVDIFLVKYDAFGNVLWAKSAGGVGNDVAVSVTTDRSGNAYTLGAVTSHTVTFDAVTLPYLGDADNDLFIAKYDSSGHLIWAKNFGGGNFDGDIDPASISVDGLGNVYVAGIFSSAWVTFGATTLFNSAGATMFLVKFSPSGDAIWAKAVPGGAGYYVSSAIDTMGHIYVTGTFGSTVSFDAISMFSNGSFDMFLAKYDTSGNIIWAKNYGTTDAEYGNYVATDIKGNVYLTGWFHGPAFPLGSDTLVNSYSPATDYYIAKFDSSGNVLWARSSIGPGNSDLSALTVDNSGNVYSSGTFYGADITFGSDTLHNGTVGARALFVTKYDALGDNVWAIGADGIGGGGLGCIAQNVLGQVYLTGAFSSSFLTLGGTTLTGTNRSQYFIARLDTALHHTNSLPAIIGRTNGINIFPNPNTGKLTVQLNTTGVTGLQVYDCLARQLFTTTLTGTETTTQIDLQNIPSGLYYLHATGSAHNENIPFVVSR